MPKRRAISGGATPRECRFDTSRRRFTFGRRPLFGPPMDRPPAPVTLPFLNGPVTRAQPERLPPKRKGPPGGAGGPRSKTDRKTSADSLATSRFHGQAELDVDLLAGLEDHALGFCDRLAVPYDF